MVLAHYIGEVKKTDPHGYIHILSKDKDFDALINHYKTNGTFAARRTSFSEIPVLMNLAERATLLALNFKSDNGSRPKSRKTLAAQIQASFGKALSPEEVEATINRLIADKIITLSDHDQIDYPTSTLQTLSPPPPHAMPLVPDKSKTLPNRKDQSPVSIEPFTYVLRHLREHPKNRPTRKTALIRHLLTVLGNKVTEADVVALVEKAVRAKQLSIDVKNKVTYQL